MNTAELVVQLPKKESFKKPLPLFECRVSAGFPSPAEEYLTKRLNLHDLVVQDEDTTYFVEAEGDSMINAGIYPGTKLVVNTAIEAQDGDIVVAFLDGGCFVKRLRIEKGKLFLCPENKSFPSYEVTTNETFRIFGVVTAVCTILKRNK